MNFLQSAISFIKDLPVVVKIVWLIALLFALLTITLIIYLTILRLRLRKHNASKLKYLKEYEVTLVNYLYANEEGVVVSAAQKKIIRSLKLGLFWFYRRRLLIEVMIKLLGEISGEMTKSISQLFIELGLLKQAKAKLKNKNWHIVAIGIRDLRKLKIEEVHEEVSKHINHPKLEVRRQAHLYFLNVFGYEGLSFMSELKSDISLWDQIGFLEILGKIDDQTMPDVSEWLHSSNDFVVLFTLELVKFYNLVNTKEILLKLIYHQSSEIRFKTIEVLNHFYISEAKKPLLALYKKLSKKEQIAVFKMLENMADEEDQSFILKHLNSEVFEIKIMAVRILKRINVDEFQEFKTNTKNISNKEIIRFIETN